MLAPLGVIVKLSPEHITPPDTVKLGAVLTVTVLTTPTKSTHPVELVPVTVYEVVDVGLTTLDPDEYVYVDAPLGVSVKLSPEHITPLDTAKLGVALTVIVLTTPTKSEHPVELVPVTV